MSPPRTPSGDNASASSAKATLNEHGLRPRRTLGQNFLADESLCTKIAELTLSRAGGSVLEIGAGLGALTAPLLQLGGVVAAVETDPGLVAVLRIKFAEPISSGQLQLIEADARELDFERVLSGLPSPRVFAGNLPYHLSGLLLRRAVDHGRLVQRSVFLLQLEVVGRLCAAPGTEAYGALSVFAQAVYAPRRAFVVRRGAFYPQPTVDSAVVVLEPLEVPRATLDEPFSGLVRAAFEKRRKTLRNAWREIFGLSMPELEQLALDAAIDLGARGETLGVVDFERMAAAIRGRGASV